MHIVNGINGLIAKKNVLFFLTSLAISPSVLADTLTRDNGAPSGIIKTHKLPALMVQYCYRMYSYYKNYSALIVSVFQNA